MTEPISVSLIEKQILQCIDKVYINTDMTVFSRVIQALPQVYIRKKVQNKLYTDMTQVISQVARSSEAFHQD